MTNIGFATLSVIPSFDGFRKQVERDTATGMAAAGKLGGKEFGDAAAKEIGKAGSAMRAEFADLPRTARGSISETSKEFRALSPELKVAVTQANAEAANLLAGSARAQIEGNARLTGSRAGDAIHDGLVPAASKAGEDAADAATDSFSSKLKDGIKKGALAAGAVAGVALGAGIVGALERGALSDKLAAQLGVGEKKSAQLGKVAGELYSDAYGDSLEGVNGALRAVVTNLDGFRKASAPRLKEVTATVLDLNAAFDEEPEAIARAATQLVRTDLAKGPKQALDIITRGFQTGADKSQDLLDTFNEYGTQFRKLGLNGKQATGLLTQGLKGGARDADIVADSLKEFSLKTQEATTKTQKLAGGKTALNLSALGEAFEAIGVEVLDADNNLSKVGETFQKDLAGGGDKARTALDKVLDGLRQIDDPLERNRTAVALFGTQAEDMGDALYSLDLDTAARKLGDVSGAAAKMGDTLSDNAATKIEGFKRKVKTSLVDFIANDFIPFFEDDVQPILEDFSAWFKRDGADALRDFGGDVKDVTGKVSDLVGFLNDLPKPAKVAGILALVSGVGAAKLTGGGGGALGTAGKVLGLSKPVPVLVTNPGFSAGGGGAGGNGGKVAALTKGAAKALPPVLIIGGLVYAVNETIVKPAKANATRLEPTRVGFDSTLASIEGVENKAKGFGTTLDLVGSKKVEPKFAVPGLAKSQDGLQEFLRLQIQAGKPITPYIYTSPIERAIELMRTLNAEIGRNAAPERGATGGVPYLHGGQGPDAPANQRTGVVIDQRGSTIVAHDYNDFVSQTQRRAQQSGLGGF